VWKCGCDVEGYMKEKKGGKVLGVGCCWVLGAGLVVLGIYRSAVPDYTVLNCKWISVDGGGWVDGWMGGWPDIMVKFMMLMLMADG